MTPLEHRVHAAAEEAACRHDPITHRALYGVIWSFAGHAAAKGLALITLSILARFLTQYEFGLVAIAMVTINYLSIFKEFGLGAALIQQRDQVANAADTVFTLNLAIGLLLTLIAFPLAPLAVDFFADAQAIPLVRTLALSFLIDALGSVHLNLLKRQLDFRTKMIPDFGSAMVKGGCSIVLAVSGFGVWSLVWGQLAGAVTSAALAWIVVPWRPRIAVRPRLARPLLKYGASIMGVDAVTTVTENLPQLMVGKFFGMALLGVYALAYRLPEMLIIANLWVIGGVAFPAFASVSDQPEALRRGFLATIRVVGLLAAPLCLGLMIAARPIVLALFGEQWENAVPLLRILAGYAWVYSIGFHDGGVYKAIGRPNVLLKLSLITLLVTLPVLFIGASLNLLALALGQLGALLLIKMVRLRIVARLLGITVRDILGQLKPSLWCGLAVSAPILISLLLTPGWAPLAQLTMILALGGLSYCVSLWILEKETLRQLHRIFSNKAGT